MNNPGMSARCALVAVARLAAIGAPFAAFLLVCILASLPVTQAAFAQPHTATGTKGAERILRVASELDFPPLAMVKEDGSADGFSVDLFKAVARVMGLKYRIYTGAWNSIKDDAIAGKADLLINMAINPERAAGHDFTVPHTVTHAAIFVRKGRATLQAPEDLRGKSLLVVAGDHVHHWVAQQPWGTNLVAVDTVGAAMKLLAEGKHDAVLVARIVGLLTLKSAGIDNIEASVLSLPGAEQKFAFAVRKGDADLLAKLNEGLAVVRADGTYSQFYDQWFNPIDPRGIPLREVILYATPVLALLLIAMILLAYRLRLTTISLRAEHASLEAKVTSRTEDLALALEGANAANRSRAEFMNNVTHELRTPLNGIIGFAELLKDDVPGPLNAQQAEFAADILASGLRLLALVDGILEMTRLDVGESALKREPVAIGAVLEECVAARRTAAEATGVSLRLAVMPDTGSAELDPRALRRMVDALLDNAVRFNREGGEVAVSARRDGESLEIAVADTGIGIAREDLPTLFKPLIQLDAGLARNHGGAGMGLALARRLAELHGGTLDVESEAGTGSTFTLRLPMAGITS